MQIIVVVLIGVIVGFLQYDRQISRSKSRPSVIWAEKIIGLILSALAWGAPFDLITAGLFYSIGMDGLLFVLACNDEAKRILGNKPPALFP